MLALVLAPACQVADDVDVGSDATPGDEPLVPAPATAIFPAACATATAQSAIVAGGKLKVTNRAYTATGCADAYLIDLTNKGAAPYTNIAWDEATPTTEAACKNARLRIGLWDRTAATPVSLGERVATGIWFRAPDNTFRCRTPRMLLQQEYAAYKPNSTKDWRLVVRAQQDAGTTITKKRFSYADVDSVARQPQDVDNVLQNIKSSGTNVNLPFIDRVWQRPFDKIGRQCRASQLELSLMELSGPSLVKAGAASADVTARNTKYRDVITSLCVLGATELEFQNNMVGFLEASIKVRNALGTQYATQASTLGLAPNQFGTQLMDQLEEVDLGRIAKNCTVDITTLFNFITAEIVPPGMGSDRLLFGSCSTNSNEKAAQVGAKLGVGGSRTGSAARATLKDCMAPLLNGAATNVCNDPRAADSAEEGQPAAPPPDEDEDDVVCYDADNNMAACGSTFVQMPVQVMVGAAAGDTITVDIETDAMNLSPDGNRAEVQVIISIAKDDPDKDGGFGEWFFSLLDDFGVPGANTLGNLYQYQIAHPELFPTCLPSTIEPECYTRFAPEPRPAPNSGMNPNRYCAADFAPGGWYADYDSQYTTDALPHQLDEDDRLDHCLCAMMEPKYVGISGGLSGIAVSSMCPSAAEKRAQDCLTPGNTDGPKPGCMTDILPGYVDEKGWNARICDAINCGPNKQRSMDDDGACSCIDKPEILGSPTLGCAVGNVALCTEDNPGPCLCMPIDYGVLPFGNDPLCLVDATRFPGTLDGWLFSDPAAAIVSVVNNERFMMLDPGASGQTAAVEPMLYRANFPNLGTTIRPRTVISRAPAQGQNLDLQLYCTNYDNNLIHGAMGQCRLNAQAPATPGSCEITLNASLRDSCFKGGGFALEWVAQAPVAYTGYIGFGKFDFGGTLTPTPANQLGQPCPTPTPDLFAPRPLPVWQGLGGTPSELFQDFLLSSGSRIPIESTFYRPRD